MVFGEIYRQISYRPAPRKLGSGAIAFLGMVIRKSGYSMSGVKAGGRR